MRFWTHRHCLWLWFLLSSDLATIVVLAQEDECRLLRDDLINCNMACPSTGGTCYLFPPNSLAGQTCKEAVDDSFFAYDYCTTACCPDCAAELDAYGNCIIATVDDGPCNLPNQCSCQYEIDLYIQLATDNCCEPFNMGGGSQGSGCLGPLCTVPEAVFSYTCAEYHAAYYGASCCPEVSTNFQEWVACTFLLVTDLPCEQSPNCDGGGETNTAPVVSPPTTASPTATVRTGEPTISPISSTDKPISAQPTTAEPSPISSTGKPTSARPTTAEPSIGR